MLKIKKLFQFLTPTILFILFTHNVCAKNYVDIVIEAKSEQRSKSAAKQEMRDKAVEEVSINSIKELIGENKYDQNLQVITQSILKNTGKFIPYVKDSDFEKAENGYQMNVSVKLSVDDLKQVLLNYGLLYKLEGQPRVMPFIPIVDHVNSAQLYWWVKDQSEKQPFLAELLRHLHKHIYETLYDHEFYQIRPILNEVTPSLPEAFQRESLNLNEIILASEFMNAQIMLTGKISISDQSDVSDLYVIKMNIKALQTGNSRIIAEVSRNYKTDIGTFRSVVQKKFIEASEKMAKDLSVQILEAWQKGVFGANLLKLTLNGSWNYNDLMVIKKGISQIKDIKALRERLYSPGSVTFEVDVPMGAKQFSKALMNKNVEGYKLSVVAVEEDQVSLEATPVTH